MFIRQIKIPPNLLSSRHINQMSTIAVLVDLFEPVRPTMPIVVSSSLMDVDTPIATVDAVVATTAPVVVAAGPSKNSLVASSGNKAEDLLCTSEFVRLRLTTYFGKPIAAIKKVPGRKKADVTVVFEDNTTVQIQNKNGNNARGFSVDRRQVGLLTEDPALRELLSVVCLKGEGVRTHVIDATASIALIDRCFIGDAPAYAPQYMTHTILKDGDISEISICSMTTFVEHLKAELYPTIVPKRTCVHLSPSIYLQRKGGGNTDKKADDIQTKWRQGSLASTLFTALA